jgi:flagellar secretion chaperone FliS
MYEKRNVVVASYGRMANSETDPLQQLVMLYDGAIKFLRLSADDIGASEIARKAEHVNRALDILNYLQGILDFDKGGEVAHTLDKLYTLVSMKVLKASAVLDEKGMRTAAELLVPVRDSWAVVAAASKQRPQVSDPIPTNTPRLGHAVVA